MRILAATAYTRVQCKEFFKYFNDAQHMHEYISVIQNLCIVKTYTYVSRPVYSVRTPHRLDDAF